MTSSEGAMRVFLVRHGRTVLNAQDRLRGLADPPLDEIGVAQAEAVAEALRGRGIEAVRSSPLQRAVRTAEVMAHAWGVPASADSGFNDRDYGPWTGHERSQVLEQFGTVDAAPGVESTDAVLQRVFPALDELSPVGGTGDDGIAVVSHDAVIRPLLLAIDPSLGEFTIETGSWSEIRRDDQGWKVVSVDNRP